MSKERLGLTKKITHEESQIEKQRSRRHEVLQKSHVEEVSLPTTTGTFEDLLQRSERSQSQAATGDSAPDTESQGFSQKSSKTVKADAEEAGKLDFSSLRANREIQVGFLTTSALALSTLPFKPGLQLSIIYLMFVITPHRLYP